MRLMRDAIQRRGALFSRREFGGLLAFLTSRLPRAAGAVLESDGIWTGGGSRQGLTERRYRVDATVLLFSVPMLRRISVGGARLAVREALGGNDRKLALEFAAGSDPKRAHGLSRMGWLREVVAERESAPVRTGVLGIMSDSPEQSVQEARSAFVPNPDAQVFVAIDSASAPGQTRSRVARFRGDYPSSWSDERLPEDARRSLQSAAQAWRRTDWGADFAGAAPMPFLYSVYRALAKRDGEVSSAYVYNEDRYTLRLSCTPDPDLGKRFAGDGWPVRPESLVRIKGTVQNLTKRLRPARFQFWIDRNAEPPLPLRVEFEARSFLRLSFECQPPGQPKESL